MNTLKEQLQALYESHGGLFSEEAIGSGDYLLVHFEPCEQGIHLRADFERPTHFSGEVVETPTGFIIPFEPEYFDTIDHYLQAASEEISEGYLLPNNLFEEA